MSTHTQEAHWKYTVNEWKGPFHQKQLDTIFQDPSIQVVYDIGANVGGTAKSFLDCAHKHNHNIKVFCVEPDKENIHYLKDKLRNEIQNGTVIPIEIGIFYGKTEAKAFSTKILDERGQYVFYENVGGYGIDECLQTIVDKRKSNGEFVDCGHFKNKIFKLDTLENVFNGAPEPDFIKIDVEGAEKNIVIHSVLLQRAKYILLEWNHADFDSIHQQYLSSFDIVHRDFDILLRKKSEF